MGKSFPYKDAKFCDLTYCYYNFVWKVCIDYVHTTCKTFYVQRRFVGFSVDWKRQDVNIK